MFSKLNIVIDQKSVWRTQTPSSLTMSLPFYLLEWGHFIAQKEYYTIRENSSRFLLFHTLSGKGRLTYSGKVYVLNANSVATIWCDKPHRYETLSKEPWDFQWFHYNGSAAHEYYNLLNTQDIAILHIEPDGIKAKQINDIVSIENPHTITENLRVTESIVQLMTSLISLRSKIEQYHNPKIENQLRTALDFMLENIDKKISVDDISRSVYMSYFHFSHIFKKQTGTSPYEFLIYLRLNRAKELLITTNDSLETISDKCGFSNSKSLIYHFNRTLHITPIQYKKANAIN